MLAAIMANTLDAHGNHIFNNSLEMHGCSFCDEFTHALRVYLCKPGQFVTELCAFDDCMSMRSVAKAP